MQIDWTRSPVDIGEDLLIPLALVKRHARIFDSGDDALVSDILFPAAVAMVQRDTRWQVEPITLTAELPPFPPVGRTFVRLPMGPFVSVVATTTTGEDEPVAIDPPSINHDFGMPGTLVFPPIVADHDKVNLSVRIGAIPPEPSIRIMILTLVAHMYEHREAATADGEVKEVPIGYRHLVAALDPMTDGYNIAGGC